FQAEHGIRYVAPSRGLGVVYKRHNLCSSHEDLYRGWLIYQRTDQLIYNSSYSRIKFMQLNFIKLIKLGIVNFTV
ncbi:hypothetical protein ASV53_12695, partial [Photobacterium sanguinicancri]